MKNFNEMFDRWVTKKSVLLVSGILSLIPILFQYMGISSCGLAGCGGYASDVLLTFFYPSLVMVFFVLLTYSLQIGIFRSWIRFAIVWVLLTVIWVVLTPHHPSGSFGIDQKPFLALSLAALLTLISLIIIAWKYIATRHGKSA